MFSRIYQPYYEIVKHKVLWLERHEGGIICRFEPNPKYPLATSLADIATKSGVPAFTEVIVMGHLLKEGPKLFDFASRECEALENFELSLPGREYAQPYPTILIRLPADYTSNRVVRFADSGQEFTHKPRDLVVRHDPSIDRIMVLIRMDSTQVLTRNIRLLPERAIEESWKESCVSFGEKEKFLDVSQEEEILSNSLTRLALAANLFLMTYGVKKIGPENPAHHNRLQRFLKNAEKSGDHKKAAGAAFDLRVTPILYSFAQQVKLYKVESSSAASGSGVTVKPHWRRGHFKMQAYGPHSSLRKRIAIHAVLVNAHLFKGEEQNTQATYHLR